MPPPGDPHPDREIEPWSFPEAVAREESVTPDWERVGQATIAGVVVKQVKNVPTGYGHLVELWREDWALDPFNVRQVFQATLAPGKISAWHAHAVTTDRLFVSSGMMQIVLFDSRPDSPTRGIVNAFTFGALRPALVIVPPRVWHGVKNVHHEASTLTNLVDEAYSYTGPDHWALPADSPRIPHTWR